MYKISYAKRLEGDTKTMHIMSNMMVQEHIFNALDHRLKTYFGAHCLFRSIENGSIRVYGAFTDTDLLSGIGFGNLDEDNNFVAHVMFFRNCDVADGCRKCADIMIEEYKTEGIEVQNIIGYIPDQNRAALRMARRFGCKDKGLTKEVVWINNNYHYPCRIMIKEVR